jgi:hypothetical protein
MNPKPPEPPIQRNVAELAPGFQWRLGLVLKDANDRLAALNLKYRFEVFEGLRTNERQEWLYNSGRTYEGPWLTNAASAEESWHFFGLGADCVPRPILADGSLGDFTWDVPQAIWTTLYNAAQANGCTTGLHWPHTDMDHVQPAGVRISPSMIARSLYKTGGLEAVWKATAMLT